jgi:hypothetical protein
VVFSPANPKVAVILASDRAGITDFLFLYQIHSSSGVYNAYTGELERKLTSVSGGLDLVPDFSFAKHNTLLGKSPDIVIQPVFPHMHKAQNHAVLTVSRSLLDHTLRRCHNP